MAQATTDIISKGANASGNRGPTKNDLFVDDILLASIWARLKIALACRVESLCALLGSPELCFHRRTLPMEKNFKITCSRAHTQFLMRISTRDLTLGNPGTKRADLVTFLSTAWNSSRKRLTLRKADSLLGSYPT